MSIPIPVDEIEAAAAAYGNSAYVLVSSSEGPPRVTHSMVRFDGGELVVSIGRRAVAAIAHNPGVTVLWPATQAQSTSLIVDGSVVGSPSAEGGVSLAADGGEVRIVPSGAVRHRPAAV